MFYLNDDKSIYVTRGDIVFFTLTANDDGVPYLFREHDIIRFKVFAKKDCENVAFAKDFLVEEPSESIDILLTAKETRIGEVISKPTDYWYEIELNPDTNPQTIIGYDEDGAKVFKLFPEGDDIVTDIEEEDIPIVDAELDLSSDRPVQNRAIARAILNLDMERNGGVFVGEGEMPEGYNVQIVMDGEADNSFLLRSSTEGSSKVFRITVDDTGTLRATEITEGV